MHECLSKSHSNVHNRIRITQFFIEIEKVCLTKEHKEILNKTKNFFNTAHVETDKKKEKKLEKMTITTATYQKLNQN